MLQVVRLAWHGWWAVEHGAGAPAVQHALPARLCHAPQAPNPTHLPNYPATCSGRAAAGALCTAACRGCRPLPAAHRELQPRAVRQHPPARTEVGEPRALPAGPQGPGLHGEGGIGWGRVGQGRAVSVGCVWQAGPACVEPAALFGCLHWTQELVLVCLALIARHPPSPPRPTPPPRSARA